MPRTRVTAGDRERRFEPGQAYGGGGIVRDVGRLGTLGDGLVTCRAERKKKRLVERDKGLGLRGGGVGELGGWVRHHVFLSRWRKKLDCATHVTGLKKQLLRFTTSATTAVDDDDDDK